MNLNAVFQAVKPSNAGKKLSNIWDEESIADGQTITALDPAATMLFVFREDWSVEGNAASRYAERQERKRLLKTLKR